MFIFVARAISPIRHDNIILTKVIADNLEGGRITKNMSKTDSFARLDKQVCGFWFLIIPHCTEKQSAHQHSKYAESKEVNQQTVKDVCND